MRITRAQFISREYLADSYPLEIVGDDGKVRMIISRGGGEPCTTTCCDFCEEKARRDERERIAVWLYTNREYVYQSEADEVAAVIESGRYAGWNDE